MRSASRKNAEKDEKRGGRALKNAISAVMTAPSDYIPGWDVDMPHGSIVGTMDP
jgi:hypothetical protein